ncbi:MAG: metallophosphoesterase [Christensenellaceae bacterium]
MFNNNTIEFSHYGIYSEKVKNELTIAHLSDLHEKEFGLHNKQLFDKVESVNPDFIAMTGDIVAHEKQKTLNSDYTKRLARGLSKIAPTYFVTGNHERKFFKQIKTMFDEYGIITVKEKMHTILVKETTINLSGMDDISFEDSDVLKSVLPFKKSEGFNVFLAHRPEYFPLYINKNIDLILCGHTHAGQIRFPVIGSFAMSGQGLFPKYMQGEFVEGNTTMIISRGLGSSGYPAVRINNPPELVVVNVAPLLP